MSSQIGLNEEYTGKIVEHLNTLLATSQQFYMNVRGYHWNVKGEQFFQLHVKFEELYNELILQIDEIAERVLTLGRTPMHTYADYMKTAKLEPSKDVTNGRECVEGVLKGLTAMLEIERAIAEVAGEQGDEATLGQMADYITAQEKHYWMYNAFLGN